MSGYNIKKYVPYTGLLGVVIIWAGTIVGMFLAGLNLFDKRPISYLGVNASSELLFTLTLLLSAVLFSVFGIYVYKILGLPKKFLAAYLVGQVGQMVAALVPFGGPYKLIHTYAAFTLAFSIPFHMYFFTRAHKPERFHMLGTVLFRAELLCFVVGIGTFVFIQKAAPITEILPAIPFHAWLIITGLRLRQFSNELDINIT